MTLKELEIGNSAVVKSVGGEGALRQHFLDMGVIPGAEVTVVKLAPMGDPIELRIQGYELTLRLADAAQIAVDPITSSTQSKKKAVKKTLHPGLGEEVLLWTEKTARYAAILIRKSPTFRAFTRCPLTRMKNWCHAILY